jgi:hypothetical protein
VQASGQGIEIIKRHLRDRNAEFSGLVFSDFARDYLTGWQAVYCEAHDVVDCAEFLRVVV